ncbi:MAG: hypothetical protein F4207_05575 [Gemmatimonadetes bacterium]|nr:hypothetical protein [Gemmatimonadota bacterium]MYG15885.1 hypothetical protein [Gemmatimonadota bacterium]
MIAFHRSSFHWRSRPWKPDPVYKYTGGFVGVPGQAYQVRFHLEAACTVEDLESGRKTDLYLGAPCRTEYTIARRNLFQIPSDEWRMAFSRSLSIPISRRPSTEPAGTRGTPLEEQFKGHEIDIRQYDTDDTLTNAREVVQATLDRDLMNVRITWTAPDRSLKVTLEFPVDLININEEDAEFQVCTGPVVLPDLETWDGSEVHRVFLADAAVSGFDHAEFILRREIEAAEREKHWYEAPRGRDRLELNDPEHPPPDYPPRRPRPLVYNETWEKATENVILRTKNER